MIKKLAAWFTSERNSLFFWLGLAALLRLAYVIKSGPGGISPDALDWMETGWRIASGEGFGGSWRPPAYAFYLAGVFSLFGKSVMAAKFMNALLGTATVYLAYLTGRLLFTARTGIIAAALMSFYPYFIAYSADLLSETFLTFMLAAGVYAVVRAARRPGWGNIAAAGVVIGLAGLTKSTVLPFFMLACAWIWWRSRSFKAGFMVGVFTLLTILPWSLRNYFHYDANYVMPVNTPWYTLYGSSCDTALVADSLPERDSPLGNDTVAGAIPDDWEYVSSLPLPERDKYCKDKALSWIRDNPDKFRYLVYKRFTHFWRLYPLMAWPWQKYIAMATSGIYIPLCFIGLAAAWRRWRDTSLLLALFASYTAVHMVFIVTMRYRIPLDTFVILCAALAVDMLLEKLRPSRA